MDPRQTICVGWRKQNDTSTWDAVMKTKQTKTKTKKTKPTIAVESFNSTESYKTVSEKKYQDRLRQKRVDIQNQITEAKQREIQAAYDLQRQRHEERKIASAYLLEKKLNYYQQQQELEIQAAYDLIETMELKWYSSVENHIQRVEEGTDMLEWVGKLKTHNDYQFWFDHMMEYNPSQLIDIEFESEKGWYTECTTCNWSIQKGMDEDYCRCAKTISF
jgi:hypothetical protein